MELLILVGICCAVVGGILAANKNRNPVGWAALCFATGLLGILVIAALPDLKEE